MIPQQAAVTIIGVARQERRAQQAPHSSIKKGTEQAGSSSLHLGGGSTPVATTPAAAQGTLHLTRLGTPHMLRLAQDLPFGAGHEQANLAMDPHPATNNQIISSDPGKLQACAQTPEARQLFKLGTPHMHRPAQDLPFGAEHEQTKLVMDPKPAINTQIISDDHGKLQESAQTPEALQLLKLGTPHMHRPAQDLPFGADQEQAKPAKHPLSTNNKQINSDDRDKLQECVQTPETRQALKTHGGNAVIKLKCLVRNTPPPPLATNYEQGGSSGPQRRGESIPQDTLGQNILQSTQLTTQAKPRLPRKHVPTNMPAKEGMGQQQLSHAKGDLQKNSVRLFWRAAAGKSSCAEAANARPHNKRHAQLLAQVPGCTKPSPWG